MSFNNGVYAVIEYPLTEDEEFSTEDEEQAKYDHICNQADDKYEESKLNN